MLYIGCLKIVNLRSVTWARLETFWTLLEKDFNSSTGGEGDAGINQINIWLDQLLDW